MGGGGGGDHVPKVLRHFLTKFWVNIWILGIYKSYLTVVQKWPITKLPQVCPKWGGGGVKATFGQCPKERRFFLCLPLVVFTESSIYIYIYYIYILIYVYVPFPCIFLRSLIGPQITWSVWGLWLVNPPSLPNLGGVGVVVVFFLIFFFCLKASWRRRGGGVWGKNNFGWGGSLITIWGFELHHN
jgi:hypothetical protein